MAVEAWIKFNFNKGKQEGNGTIQNPNHKKHKLTLKIPKAVLDIDGNQFARILFEYWFTRIYKNRQHSDGTLIGLNSKGRWLHWTGKLFSGIRWRYFNGNLVIDLFYGKNLINMIEYRKDPYRKSDIMQFSDIELDKMKTFFENYLRRTNKIPKKPTEYLKKEKQTLAAFEITSTVSGFPKSLTKKGIDIIMGSIVSDLKMDTQLYSKVKRVGYKIIATTKPMITLSEAVKNITKTVDAVLREFKRAGNIS